MAKKAKADAKRQRRLDRSGDEEDDIDLADTDEPGPQVSNEKIMEKVADLHRRYEDGQMDLDSFDEEKALLLGQISVD